jgi:beta-fructofuranosidase
MEIVAEIDLKMSPMVEINVLRSANKDEYTRIAFFRERGFRAPAPNQRASLITLETSYSSILPDVQSRAPETAPIILKPGEKLSLRIFIDKSVVEVFANGRQCVAARVYPGLNDSKGVSLCARGQDAKLIYLDAWQMKNIYE